MKKTIFVFIISLVILSCNSKPKEVFKPHSDTAKLWGTYIDFPSSNIVNGVTFRIITETISVDSFLNVKEIFDTAYWIVPSIDTVFKKTINGSIVYDLHVDSTIAKLQRFIAANKNLWDTTAVSSPQNKPIQ